MSRNGGPPPLPAVLAVDGGNSKTDVALVEAGGRVLAMTRVPISSHLGIGGEGSIATLGAAITQACLEAGLDPQARPLAKVGVYCLAGADLPVDVRRITRELSAAGWTEVNILRNDTFAVLRAGTERGWGVAVVCGAGLNCAGVGPDGRIVRFPSLGDLSGDAATGGQWLGTAALGAAVRGRDGRGPRTLLERSVPAHFGMTRPAAVMEAVYTGTIDARRLLELPPLVFAAGQAGDAAAATLIDRVATEIVDEAGAAIRRLRMTRLDVEVILGGGIFRSGDARLIGHIRQGVEAVAPRASVRTLDVPPVLGAALIGLDRIGAGAPALARARTGLAPGSG